MSSQVFKIKQGDTWSPIECVLLDANDELVVLSGDESVRFHLYKVKGKSLKTLVDKPAVIASMTYKGDTVNGVKYGDPWDVEDTDRTADDYNVEWEVTFEPGVVGTFPNNDQDPIICRIAKQGG